MQIQTGNVLFGAFVKGKKDKPAAEGAPVAAAGPNGSHVELTDVQVAPPSAGKVGGKPAPGDLYVPDPYGEGGDTGPGLLDDPLVAVVVGATALFGALLLGLTLAGKSKPATPPKK